MRVFHTLLLATTLAVTMAQAVYAETGQITVTGEAVIASAPDIATVSLGVVSTGSTAAQAMDANSAAMTAVLARLRAAGVAEADLQTSNLSLNPTWNNDQNQPQINGYSATNQLSVRVRALDSLGAVLDAAIADGANTLNGISFDLATPRPIQDAARKAAVADAIARATLLAAAAGVELGPILSISEAAPMSGPMPMFRATAEAVPVAAGQVELSQSVTVVFEIKQ